MIDLQILRGDLQKLVSINSIDGRMNVDLALGLIGAYMLQNGIDCTKEWSAMGNYLTFLRSDCFRGKKKAIVSGSGFTDCVVFIKNYLLAQPFENKKGTLLSLKLKVITDVEENGYLSFNDKTFNVYSDQTLIGGVPSMDYKVELEEIMVPDTDLKNESMNISSDDILPMTDTIDNNFEDNDNKRKRILIATKTSNERNNITNNSPFVHLYDKLLNANREKRETAIFGWQWYLSLDEYTEIKNCFDKHPIPTPGNRDTKTSLLLALYIGEFYKREYDGNNNPFSQFEKENPNHKFDGYNKLCDDLKIERYKKTNHTHLHTLYVRGGLPIHYISSMLDDNRSSLFIDSLSKLLEIEDFITINEGEDELEKINNTSLKESYHQGHGHSIYEYIQTIMNELQPWCSSDNGLKDFKDFIEKVKAAKDKSRERRKFKIFYSLWTIIDNNTFKEFYLTPQLRFNPEEDGERHYALNEQRLKDWGIQNPPSQFCLEIENQSLTFTKCCKGDFISWDLIDRIDLPSMDNTISIEDIAYPNYIITYKSKEGDNQIPKNNVYLPFKNGYSQFYTNDDPMMATWNSFKGGHSFLWSGLLYDRNRYLLLSSNSNNNIVVNEQFGWVFFQDSVTFEDIQKNKTCTIFNSKGQIYAKPKDSSFHDYINDSNLLLSQNCLLGGMAECTIGREKSHAYIVKSSDLEFNIYRVATDEPIAGKPNVEFKNVANADNPWVKYESQHLNEGLYVFRLSYARYATEINCYILPDDAHIEFYNSNTPYLIKFMGFNIVYSKDELNTTPINNNEGIQFHLRDSNRENYYRFRIGDENACISLQTYHPKPQTHVYLFGKEINKTPIIIAFAENLEVREISAKSASSGPYYLSEKATVYQNLFDVLTETARNDRGSTKTKQIKYNKTLSLRVYTEEIQDNPKTDAKLFLMDLENNELHNLSCQNNKEETRNLVSFNKHDGLLFQSLKDVNSISVYYVPKFIPVNGIGAAPNVRYQERTARLTEYASQSMFCSNYAFQQFEIACEHRLYFAVFDSLLSMCWNAKKIVFLDRTKKPFKKNIFDFINNYVLYCEENFEEPSISGLKRLAREYLFDWKIIKQDVENTRNAQLIELFNRLINN